MTRASTPTGIRRIAMTEQRQRTDRGASAAEYALLAAGIAALIAGIVFLLGPHVSDLFGNTCDKVAGATHQGACT
ncbi:Flp family type IVb pilin [Nocardioides sp. BP30]|uniref:Flp family type IVb pilin n=1 Tax=Nocardioides sp. BP30 TaxID=3036374 RepID=UPI002469856E|nr:Flp family type IVb pilin [Nocardioides sp. BP30]WGL53804.1 Flp family type IVb pilin [Nocardioides sp. BP30]